MKEKKNQTETTTENMNSDVYDPSFRGNYIQDDTEAEYVGIYPDNGDEVSKESSPKKKEKRPKKKKGLVNKIILTVVAAFFAISFLLPTILTFTNSFMSEQEINSNYGVIFNNYNEDNEEGANKRYRTETVNLKLIPDKVVGSQYSSVLLKSPDYLMKFWNSVILTLPIMIFQVLLALGAAYSFARFRGRIREILFFVYLMIMLIPYQVSLVPNYMVNSWLGLLDTRWSIILPGIFAPFSVYILTKHMRRIPESIIEAAKLDGANEWRIFWKRPAPRCKGPIAYHDE